MDLEILQDIVSAPYEFLCLLPYTPQTQQIFELLRECFFFKDYALGFRFACVWLIVRAHTGSVRPGLFSASFICTREKSSTWLISNSIIHSPRIFCHFEGNCRKSLIKMVTNRISRSFRKIRRFIGLSCYLVKLCLAPHRNVPRGRYVSKDLV